MHDLEPSWKLFDFAINTHHRCLARLFTEVASNDVVLFWQLTTVCKVSVSI